MQQWKDFMLNFFLLGKFVHRTTDPKIEVDKVMYSCHQKAFFLPLHDVHWFVNILRFPNLIWVHSLDVSLWVLCTWRIVLNIIVFIWKFSFSCTFLLITEQISVLLSCTLSVKCAYVQHTPFPATFRQIGEFERPVLTKNYEKWQGEFSAIFSIGLDWVMRSMLSVFLTNERQFFFSFSWFGTHQ